jgi:phosphoribosylamine-glycine ligase
LSSIQSDDDGVITLTYNATNVGAGGTVVISPFIKTNTSTVVTLRAGVTANTLGPVDWACAGEFKTIATTGGMGAAAVGTMKTKYVPANCR